MERMAIAEPGRYYHERRAIILRTGLKIEEERRYLWHELVHARRGDMACSGWASSTQERSVEREAAQLAMPLRTLEWGVGQAAHWDDFVSLMKVPGSWVRFRLTIGHPAEKAILNKACRWARELSA